MGKRKKLQRFEETRLFANVFEFPLTMRGKWRSDCFHNSYPLILELGCGKGEYTLALARLFPKKNVVGMDIKGIRIWRGAKTGLENHLMNAYFVRAYIDHLTAYFAPREVDEIWIPFPDPYPRKKQNKKRLTSPVFLDRYKKVMRSGGLIHLKTDDERLFAYTLETVEKQGGIFHEVIEDVYANETVHPLLCIQTTFEKKHRGKGKSIHYVCFSL